MDWMQRESTGRLKNLCRGHTGDKSDESSGRPGTIGSGWPGVFYVIGEIATLMYESPFLFIQALRVDCTAAEWKMALCTRRRRRILQVGFFLIGETLLS